MSAPRFNLNRDEIMSEFVIPMFKGTVVGVATRWGGWPLEYGYILKSKPENTLTYRQIFQGVTWRELHGSFVATGVLQAILSHGLILVLSHW